MAETKIAWTHYTFNPWMGCTKVSPGCAHCYAETLVKGKMGLPGLWGPRGTRMLTGIANWAKPWRWNRNAQAGDPLHRVFVGSLCDWAEDNPVANEARPRLWRLIRETPALTWQLLTKRPENIAKWLPADWGDGWPNVWLGTSIENNDYVWRARELAKIPAVVRFISYEPALGPLDQLDLLGIDWLIYGGESGPGYRGHEIEWPRTMRDRCAAAGVAFFYKQSPAIRTEMGTTLDGETIKQYPQPRTIAEAGRLF